MNLGGAIHLNKTGITIICGIVIILILYSTSNKSCKKIEDYTLIDLNTLLQVGIKAAENGGKKVVETKDKMEIQSKGLTKEGLKDSVTTADFLSHCAMTGIFKHYFSELKVVSEETYNCENDVSEYSFEDIENLPEEKVDINDVTVWIDPLDATHEYTEKSVSLYKYITTMVCIAVKGKPIIGIVHKPFNKVTSWAWVGKGMSEDLKKSENHIAKSDDAIKIIISRSHQGEIEKLLKQNFNSNLEVITAAGAGYKALEVAYGNVNAYMHSTAIKKWDICAGNAIIEAKGGKMTTKFDKKIDYSDSVNVKNEDGLIVTLENHETFLGKL